MLLDFSAPTTDNEFGNSASCPFRAKVKAMIDKTKRREESVNQPSVADFRKRLQLNQQDFARLLPVSVRSLATLESGTPPTPSVERRLTELHRLTTALAEVVREESIGKWLQTPNAAFGGLKPIEVIDRGEIDRLWEMVYFLRSGAAG